MIGVRASSMFAGSVWEAWNHVIGSRRFFQGTGVCELDLVRAITSNTEISRDHMTPEIGLHLLTPNCDLYHTPFASALEENEAKKIAFTEPFWSIYWPGGQALTRFILDEGKSLFSGFEKTKVLDVGCGCGASAIAAKLVGADTVVANDIDKVACVAASMNATLNHVDVQLSQENLLQRPAESLADVILVGDMLYDEEIAATLIPWLEKARQSGTRIYLGDPGRHGLTQDLRMRLKPLKRYSLPESVKKGNYGYDKCDVWEFVGL